MKRTREDKAYKRHVRIWNFARVVMKPCMRLKLGFSCDIARDDFESPYIVLSNHNSNFDSILLGLAFPKHMYFIASEQIYRQGLKSKLLKWSFEPISKIKGASDVTAVIKAIKKLRAGKNICIFPEGGRSFNGKSSKVQEATGKLVKMSGAGLVTHRLEGLYLSNPRWSKKGVRKGKTYGRIVNYYTKEQISQMSVAEITKHIQDDIYEDAFKEQDEKAIKYVGKNLAEGMECSVCVCPYCKSIDSIKTKGDKVFCEKCGAETQYSEYGYFDDSFKFKNITQWDEWQTEFYKDYFENFTSLDKPMLFDDDVKLSSISADHHEKELGRGSFYFYKDRIEFCRHRLLDKKATISASASMGASLAGTAAGMALTGGGYIYRRCA